MLTNSLLSRALGTASPFSVAQIHTSRLLLAIQPVPGVRFGSTVDAQCKHGANADAPPATWLGDSVKGVILRGNIASSNAGMELTSSNVAGEEEHEVKAHRAGVNAVVVDKFEGR